MTTPINDPYDQYLAKLSSAKRQRIYQQSSNLRTGLNAVAPLTCAGPDTCPFIAHCPIPERTPGKPPVLGDASDYPLFDDCVLERLYLLAKIKDYKTYLNVQDDNPVELSIVNDLALIDLYKNRATMLMSSGDKQKQGQDMMRIDVTMLDDNGDVAATSTNIHPAVSVIDILERRRERMLDRLLETRRGKLEVQRQLGVGSDSNKVLEELQQVRRMLEEQSSAPELLAYDGEEIKIR